MTSHTAAFLERPLLPVDEPNLDLDLAKLLAKLAALQGYAVPWHRFSMMSTNEDGVSLEDLPLAEKAQSWWRLRFPEAEVIEFTLGKMRPQDFPCLWFPESGSHVRLIRGRLGADRLSVEDACNVGTALPVTEASKGRFLALRPAPASSLMGSEAPMSASDWFELAIRRHRRIFGEAILATVMVSIFSLVTSLYSMQIYDRVLPNKGYSTLWVLTFGVLMAIVLELTMRQSRTYMVDRAGKAIDEELSSVFFGKALDIRMDARPRTVGTFASQIRHFESVRIFMTSSTLFILADVPFALLFIGVIALIAGPVALVPLFAAPLAIVAGVFFSGSIERLTARNMDESNRKNGLLIEAIDGIESIKSVAAEWKMLERWRRFTIIISESDLRLKLLTSLATNLTQTIQQTSYVGIVVAGAYAVTSGNLSMGGLIACTIISGRVLGPIAQIPNLIVQWKNAQIALKSLDSIMAMPSDREHGRRLVVPTSCEGTISIEKMSFSFDQERVAFEAPQMLIKPGERVAIVGAVGSGKSTLIKLLSGLYKPSNGSVYLDGIDMTHLDPEFVREHIGYLPQDVRLFNGTLRENLTLGLPTPSDSQILYASRLTGLEKVIQSHPRGLELEIAEGGRGLSGGQRQLLGLTRMLLAKPRILLLDEPTASMDMQLEATVMRHLFGEIPLSSSVIVVTHKQALLAHVNRIIVVDRGRIVLDGPRDLVLTRLRQLNESAGGNGIKNDAGPDQDKQRDVA